MLHSIAYLISGLMLFSFSVLPISQQSDEYSNMGQGLHGKVVDAESQEPIANATIKVEGTDASTQTEQDGTFHFTHMELSSDQQSGQQTQSDRPQSDPQSNPQQNDADQNDPTIGESEYSASNSQNEFTLVVSADGYEESEEEVSLDSQDEELVIELEASN